MAKSGNKRTGPQGWRQRLDGANSREVVRNLPSQGLRIAGNRATHRHAGDHAEALSTLKIARELGIWFHRTFADKKFSAGAFVPPPGPLAATKALLGELDCLREALDDTRSDAEKARLTAETEARERSMRVRVDTLPYFLGLGPVVKSTGLGQGGQSSVFLEEPRGDGGSTPQDEHLPSRYQTGKHLL